MISPELYPAAFWLAMAVLLVIVEALTLGLITIWFVFGSLAALVAAVLGLPLPYQIVIFVGVSGALLYFTRPLVKRFFKPQSVLPDRWGCTSRRRSSTAWPIG